MLHHTQISSLAKEHAELFQKEGADAVRAALPKTYGAKNSELDDEDVKDIISRLESGEVKPPAKKTSTENTPGAKSARRNYNDGLDLSGFDYTNLTGDAWKKYNEIESTLVGNKKYHFAIYKALPIKKDRYPGMQDSPKDIVGISLVNDNPVSIVKVEAKRALNLNEQLPNGDDRLPCQYYLLAK